MATRKLDTHSTKELALQAMQFVRKNRIIMSSAALLALGATAIIRVNSITQTSVDEKHLDKELESVQTVEFDQASIDKISELNDANIDITSDFTDRNNPFED